MLRKIIKIDEELCNGCGLCVDACHEGAIGLINGKAKLLRDDYCDGLGNCLPVCPTGAISFEEREAAAFDAAAVAANSPAFAHGCPGQAAQVFEKSQQSSGTIPAPAAASELRQWPVQLKLVAPNASFFNGAKLLVAADCAAYTHGDFHRQFMAGKVVLIGCPKLDEGDYSEKLTTILQQNDIKSLTIVRMEVPCCGGLEAAAKKALANSGKLIPWSCVTLSLKGEILED